MYLLKETGTSDNSKSTKSGDVLSKRFEDERRLSRRDNHMSKTKFNRPHALAFSPLYISASTPTN